MLTDKETLLKINIQLSERMAGRITHQKTLPQNVVLCDKPSVGRSCGKIVLVNVFLRQNPNKAVKVYAILDD